MAAEGSKPILSIEIDDSSWQSFLASYADYKAQAEKSGDEWKGFNSGIRQAKTAFDDLDSAAEHMTDALASPKTGRAFVALDKSSKETAKSWAGIAKSIDRSNRDMAGLLRNGSKFSGLLGVLGLGGIGALAGGLFAATRAADSTLADQNIANRKLGLKPGEEQAFDNVYEKAGGNSQLLGNVAAAQADPQQWSAFQAAGISQQDIQHLDAAELSARVLQNVGQKVKENGLAQTGLWSHGMGINKFVDNNSMRLAGTYADQFGSMRDEYQKKIPDFAVQQKQLDEATEARQKIEAALTQTEIEFEKALIKLNPEIVALTGEVTNAIKAFSESGKLDEAIKTTETAFEDVGKAATWLSDTLNGLFDLKGKDGDTPLYSAQAGSVGANVVQFGKNVWDTAHGGKWDNGPSPAVTWGGSGSDTASTTAKPGVTPVNNPGNLRVPGSKTQFQQFNNPDAGMLAMDKQIMMYAQRDHLSTLAQIINKWAPSSENDTSAYVKDVAGRTGFGATDKLNMADPRVRAAVEAAMIHHENGNKFAQFDQRHIEALISPFDDHKAIAAAKSSDHQAAPMQSVEQQNAHHESTLALDSAVDRVTRGLEKVGDTIRSTFADGGGSQFRMPTKTANSTQQAPVAINVTTSSPPGWSTTVTTASLAN